MHLYISKMRLYQPRGQVAKYDKDGLWMGSWGEPGSGPGQFNIPHSIASDLQNRIYVADRGNVRIQVFDTSGKLLNTIKIDMPAPANSPVAIGNRPRLKPARGNMHPGAPWALCITPGPVQYLYVSDGYPGRIYKLSLDGKVLGWLGGSGKTLKKFGWVHEIACPSENEIYVAELLNWRAQKNSRFHPVAGARCAHRLTRAAAAPSATAIPAVHSHPRV